MPNLKYICSLYNDMKLRQYVLKQTHYNKHAPPPHRFARHTLFPLLRLFKCNVAEGNENIRFSSPEKQPETKCKDSEAETAYFTIIGSITIPINGK